MLAAQAPIRFFRCVIALLVLVVCVHALAPFGESSQRLAGSAFSAGTEDVSLRAGQGAAVTKLTEALKPPVTMITAVLAMERPTLLLPAPGEIPFGLGATGPPSTATISFSPISPRAPPAA